MALVDKLDRSYGSLSVVKASISSEDLTRDTSRECCVGGLLSLALDGPTATHWPSVNALVVLLSRVKSVPDTYGYYNLRLLASTIIRWNDAGHTKAAYRVLSRWVAQHEEKSRETS